MPGEKKAQTQFDFRQKICTKTDADAQPREVNAHGRNISWKQHPSAPVQEIDWTATVKKDLKGDQRVDRFTQVPIQIK